MSEGEVRHLSGEHLQVVQNLIERCIQLHMSKIEAVSVLSRNANVVPAITELVWQRLEEENREFFQFYYIRLALKEQINRFNELLKEQAKLMERIQSTGVSPVTVSNGSRMPQFQQSAGRYPIDQTGASLQPENLQPAIPPSLPTSFSNGVSSLQTHSAYDMSSQSRRIDFLPDTLHGQSSNSMRLMQGLNGGIIKSESGHPSDSRIIFDADTNIGEPQGLLDDASVASFSGMESSSQPMHDTLLDINGSCSSFGQLQIPKNFSFPELSAFPHVLDNYQNSDFIITNTDNFLDRGETQDESKGAISESYNTYEDFGSD
ncbi:uncharacterized protein LOC141641995 isoform X2 [Silene latifolia]|uniref:uncharacterized protein LOC141641995 isoform X2 n=1 Tax=Silene latifolia TaxID=37657 RepID=UPI003D77F611